MLISSCLPIQFNHFWYHFSKVSNIFLTLLCIHCLPELHNHINIVSFTSLLIYSLSSCHKFSIGLRSGDSGGVRHQLIPFSSMNFFACFDVCLGSLSRMNLCVVGNFLFRNGINVLFRIWVYSGVFIFPSKMQISVGPF